MDDERRQSICPACPDMRAIPLLVQSQGPKKMLTYVCPHCALQWQVAYDWQDGMLRPKPD
jgi:hypothetical protein